MRLRESLKQPVRLEIFLLAQIVSMLLALASYKVGAKIIKARAVYHPIQKIIQVGQEKQSLSTVYLLELLGLSFDKPLFFEKIDKEILLGKLKQSPLIESAYLEMVYPNAIYLEYKTRRPLALLEDFKNTAVDKLKCLFPMKPFLSSKRLPKIYLGLKESFDVDADKFIEEVHWNKPLENPKLELAFSILDFISQSENLRPLLRVQRIDTSRAFEKSFGKRQIVLVDEIPLTSQGNLAVKAVLRLHHKQFTQGLINYGEWKTHYLKEHFDKIASKEGKKSIVIDLRVPQMAFVEEVLE